MLTLAKTRIAAAALVPAILLALPSPTIADTQVAQPTLSRPAVLKLQGNQNATVIEPARPSLPAVAFERVVAQAEWRQAVLRALRQSGRRLD